MAFTYQSFLDIQVNIEKWGHTDIKWRLLYPFEY